jgi:hypothetical protein
LDKVKAAKIFSQRGRVLPTRIVASWEWDQKEPWLNAAQEIEDLAEKGDTVYVGEYRLVKTHKVELKVQATRAKVL